MAVEAPVAPQQIAPVIGGVYPPAPKDYRQAGPFWRVLAIGTLLVLLALGADVWLGRPTSVSAPAAASGVLVLAGFIAVGIERLLEFLWSLMDQMAKNPSWPFSGDAKRLDDFAAQVTQIVTPALTQATQVLTSADAMAANAPAGFDNFKNRAAALQATVDAMVNARNPNYAGGLVALKQGLDDLGGALAHPEARASVVAASDAVDSLKKLVESASDDPGRRIMSLFAGMILGVLAAGVLGLDVIHAALGVPDKSISLWSSPSLSAWWNEGLAAWPWGMLATGIAIGLGSNPLHELIQGIQNWKASTGAGPASK